jgi:GT2 family glycosyltransferase
MSREQDAEKERVGTAGDRWPQSGAALMTDARVVVVVVNWNGAVHLEECLAALRKQTIREQMHVVVVDNGSTDGSRELLARNADLVTVIANSTNVGFAAGCNQGILEGGRSEFVALLNNDAMPEPTWLEAMLCVMCGDARAGSTTPKVLSYSSRQVFDNTGHVVFADGLTHGRGRKQEDIGQFERPEEVFGASGCAAVLRRSMLDDVGLLDEHFFAYCEDADLAFRARLRGWTCIYVPTAVVYHKFSATGEPFSPFKALHVERNRFWLAIKNLPLPLLLLSPGFTLVRYWWQGYRALTGHGASGRFVQQHSRGALLAILLRAYAQALGGLPRALKQRRAIQARRTASSSDVWRWLRRFGVSARDMSLLE